MTTLIILCTGLAATVAQVVLMRELVVAFHGNEISMGVMLGGWLLWTGVGSLLFSRVVDRRRLSGGALALLLLALALLLPATLFGARMIRLALGASSPGEIVSFETMAWATLALLAPVCLANGCLFSLLCRVVSSKAQGAKGVGRVYLLESIGALAGGLLFTLLLVRIGPSLLAGLMVSCVLAAVCWGWSAHAAPKHRALQAAALVLFVLAVAGAVVAPRLERWTTQRVWRPYEVIAVRESPYGRHVVVQYAEQRVLLSNGHIAVTVPPGPEAEELAHFAILSLRAPLDNIRVLVVGGGVQGVVREALKYPGASVVYAELDREVLATEALLSGEDEASTARLALDYRDGRELIEEIGGLPEGRHGAALFDVIILDLPAPYTAQLNRYYTRQFVRHAATALTRDGLLVFRVPSAETYASPMLRRFLNTIRRTVRGGSESCCGERPVDPAAGSDRLFNVAIVPGSSNIFLCCRGEAPPLEAGWFEERLQTAGVWTDYFPVIVRDRLRPDKVAFLDEVFQEELAVAVNTDLRPVCYFYDAVLWSSMFRLHGAGGEAGVYGIGRVLLTVQRLNPWWLFAAAAAAVALLSAAGWRKELVRRSFLPLAVAATGFAEITAEILCLIGFQIAHGTVYYLVGGIVAAYMGGLSLGSAVMVRCLERWGLEVLARLQLAIAGYMALAAVAIGLLLSADVPWQGVGVAAFVAVTLGAGFLGGFQFPLAAKVYLGQSGRTGERAGAIYGADLIGSCAGAFLASAVLVPVYGMIGTGLAAAGLVALSAVPLFVAARCAA